MDGYVFTVASPLDRLKNRADFLRVAALRRKWVAPGLILQIAPNPDAAAQTIRIGFTASKKVGGAVERNRAKRRLREAARRILPENARLGLDYVLIARAETQRRPYALLLQDLTTALKRLGAVATPETAVHRKDSE